jgi:glucose/arabinose dehydrogenase
VVRAALLLCVVSALAAQAHTPASAEKGAASAELRPFASGLREPVFAAADPGGRPRRLYVVELAGRIRVAEPGRALRTFLDLRSRVRRGGFRGMFSLAFHPGYASNGRFFVNYVGRDGAILVDGFRARGGIAIPSSRRTLLRVATHGAGAEGLYGGQVAFGPGGRLYASFGDGGRPEAAQDERSLLGKIVRLDPDRPSLRPEIVAYGLRNPWRFSFDRTTGNLYIGDVGDRLREEIDIVPRGMQSIPNFGWDVFEGSVRRRQATSLPGRLRRPAFEYRHRGDRCWSVVGGVRYRGTRVRDLRGRYLFGDLCGGVWSTRFRRGRAVDVRNERLRPGALAAFAEGADGELYTVDLDGAVYAIAPR